MFSKYINYCFLLLQYESLIKNYNSFQEANMNAFNIVAFNGFMETLGSRF